MVLGSKAPVWTCVGGGATLYLGPEHPAQASISPARTFCRGETAKAAQRDQICTEG